MPGLSLYQAGFCHIGMACCFDVLKMNKMTKSDIIIIGAGPGGYETAILAAEKGKSVVIIESSQLGGTCLNEGCIPTKSLCRSAEILQEIKEAAEFGVRDVRYSFDFPAAMQRKNSVVAQLRSGVEILLGHKLITVVYGKALFKSPTVIEVGEEEYTASDIIIATGSYAFVPDIPGIGLSGVMTSREILSMEEMPESLCIIGAGVIGLEFASIMNSFGCKVTVLEYCRDILPRFDTDIAKRLKQSLVKRGISIVNSARVQSLSASGSGISVQYELKGKTETIEAEKVLAAIGRRSRLDSMNFSDVGIALTPKGVQVDENMRTSVPHIYAVGDITGGFMLAHEAAAQGRRALCDICGDSDRTDLSLIPAAVFTSPEAACVGLTEQQCTDSGIECYCRKSFFRANGKAVCLGQTEGFCKIVVEGKQGEDGRILGCHLFGPHSADLIQEMTALISKKAVLSDLDSLIHPHPTLSEIYIS